MSSTSDRATWSVPEGSRGTTVDRVLVDTNILVYAEDPDEPVKRDHAALLLRDLALSERLVIFTQVLGEYVSVLGRKLANDYPCPVLVNHASILAAALPVLPVNLDVSETALRAFERFQMPYRDAQLWATAKVHGIGVILPKAARPPRSTVCDTRIRSRRRARSGNEAHVRHLVSEARSTSRRAETTHLLRTDRRPDDAHGLRAITRRG